MRAFAPKQPSSDSKRKKSFKAAPGPILKTNRLPFSSNPAVVVQRKPVCVCDGGCPRCAGTVQPKLIIGQPNDKYEQEADRVAEQVMRMPEPGLQRNPT